MSKKGTRIYYLGVIITLLMVAGFGCKGLSQAEQQSVRPVTLNFWTVYDDVGTLTAMAKEYQLQRPYIHVNVRQIRYDEYDSLLVNALADDTGPDIVSVFIRSLPKYESRLAPAPASVRMARVTVEGKYQPKTVITSETLPMPGINTIRNQYIATVAGDVIRGNQILGFPLSVDTMALLYNKNLLDKSGIAVPPSTWTEFLAAAEKTTRLDKDGNIIQSGVALGTGNNIEHAFDIMSLLMLQKGVAIADGGAITFANGLQNRDATGHPTLEALRFYTDFARPTKKVYTWNETQESALQNFARGKSVFYFGFAYDLARLHGMSPQLNIGVVSLPQLAPETPVNVANYWIESVLRKSTHQNEAWDFIRFISLPDNLKRYSDATHIPSPLRIHLQAQVDNPDIAPFTAGLLTASNWYRGHNYDAAQQAFREMIHNYLQPYGDKQDPQKRDATIVIQAASVVQQTL